MGEQKIIAKKSRAAQYVCFKLSDEEYALPIQNVQEVISPQKITPIPQMPNFCLGVLNIRGNIVPIFDLRLKFFLNKKDFCKTTKFIVVNIGDIVISFIVDKILDNVAFLPGQIDSAPVVKTKIESNCIYGIGQLPNRMVILLDLKNVYEDLRRNICKKENCN